MHLNSTIAECHPRMFIESGHSSKIYSFYKELYVINLQCDWFDTVHLCCIDYLISLTDILS